MAHPKRRTSVTRKRKRRSHHALSKPALSACPRCSYMRQPHKVCPNCGTYKGEEIVEPQVD
ncbi:MAG: 50S ribosomal protein L32 [Planctomycetota bacterium]|nr:50S ribosomal protein L32 [Planctomycetota bacterium]